MRSFVLILGFTALLVFVLIGCSAPKSNLLDSPIVEEMKQGVDSGQASFDHSEYDELLREHVAIDSHSVDYAGLKADEEKLDAYLRRVADANIEELGADEQLALLLNAYNAYTLNLILQHYPQIDSIRDIDDPFKGERNKVASYTLSLDNIEHNLIRPLFKDPRIHFAVNCAARDCPPLQPRAYTGAKIDEQLDEVTADALSKPQSARVENERLYLTKVMDWYGEDFINPEFEGHASTLGEYVARHTRDEEIRAFVAEHDGDPPVSFLDYDWRLNDVRKR